MHFFKGGGRRVDVPAEFGDKSLQLTLDVDPFAKTTRRQVLFLQFRFELPVRDFLGLGFREPVPELHVGEEVGLLVGKRFVRLIGRLLLVDGALARILHRKARSDEKHFAQGAEAAPRKEHAPQLRVDGEFRKLSPDFRQSPFGVDRPQFLQDLVAVRNRARRRRFDEGKFAHVAELETHGPQDHARQVRANDFGVRKGRTTVEVVFIVKTNANPVRNATATARALIGGSLTHGFDEKLLHFRAVGVAFDAREARIDHVPDPRYRHGRFRDVRCQNDAARAARTEDAFLLRGGKPRVKGQNFRRRRTALSEPVRGFADFVFAREKDENVAAPFGFEFRAGVVDCAQKRMVVRFVRVFDRAVADFDGVGATRNRENGRLLAVDREVLRKALRVDRRRGDDHLEVAALLQKALQVPEEKVDVDRPLVRFVDDDRVVSGEHGVRLGFGKQNPVRHEFDGCSGRRLIRKAHFEAHDFAERRLHFFRNAPRDGTRRNASGLRVGDHTRTTPPRKERDLRKLRGFARTRFAADDHHAVFFDGLAHFVGARRDGKPRGELDFRNRILTLGKGEPRAALALAPIERATGVLGVAPVRSGCTTAGFGTPRGQALRETHERLGTSAAGFAVFSGFALRLMARFVFAVALRVLHRFASGVAPRGIPRFGAIAHGARIAGAGRRLRFALGGGASFAFQRIRPAEKGSFFAGRAREHRAEGARRRVGFAHGNAVGIRAGRGGHRRLGGLRNASGRRRRRGRDGLGELAGASRGLRGALRGGLAALTRFALPALFLAGQRLFAKALFLLALAGSFERPLDVRADLVECGKESSIRHAGMPFQKTGEIV